MKKCLKMVPDFSEFLFYSHDYMLNILNNFCIIAIGVYIKVNVIFNMIPQKIDQIQRLFTIIHINEMINLKSMRLIYPH